MNFNFINSNYKRILIVTFPLILFLLWFLFPLYWMLITSIKPDKELATLQNPLFVNNPTLNQYKNLIVNSDFLIWLRNSFIVSISATIFSVIISSFAAYSISRIKIVGRWFLSRSVLFSYLVPRSILLIPLFSILQSLSLIDTLYGLSFVYLTFMVPFCTWLLIGYFSNVPYEVEECAIIDGCTRLQVLFKITIPMAMPGIITAGLFSFILSWQEFLYPLVFNTHSLREVVPVGISYLITGDLFEWGKIMAAGVIFTFPVILAYLPIQKYLVEGITAGAVKG